MRRLLGLLTLGAILVTGGTGCDKPAAAANPSAVAQGCDDDCPPPPPPPPK